MSISTEQHLIALGEEARAYRTAWDRSDDIMSMANKPKMTWTPHLAALLAGLEDPSSPLSRFKGQEESVLCCIYQYAIGFVRENWRVLETPKYKQSVHNTLPSQFLGRLRHPGLAPKIPQAVMNHLNAVCDDKLVQVPVHGRAATNNNALENTDPSALKIRAIAQRADAQGAFTRCGVVSFPEPSGIDVNMLPFIMGDKSSLPEDLQVYYDPLIAACPVDPYTDLGKVCYLSITERFIEQGSSQRRGGLHIEAPAYPSPRFLPGNEARARWGQGTMGCDGGIFMASNVSGSCHVYDALVLDQATCDSHGGCEHLRPLLNAPYPIPANELIWMTDRTPHQAVPQREAGYRQFFRLVTSDVNVWHTQHCTANPKVPLPDNVRVIRESRFEEEGSKKRNMDDATKKPAKGWKMYLSKRQLGLRAQMEAKERRMLIDPTNYFKEWDEYKGKYSKYNGDGIPTHDAEGNELTKSAVKKLSKELQKHIKQQAAWNQSKK